MAPLRFIGALLSSAVLVAESRRVADKETVLATATRTQRLAYIAEQCQDYEEEHGFGLGDTVRILSGDGTQGGTSGIVGCRDDSQEGQVCLQGKGCYDPKALRHIGTCEFGLSTARSAVSQILAAVAGDVKEQWHDVRLRLMSLSVFVSDQVTKAATELATAADVCDDQSRAATKAKFAWAFASIKSRLAMVASSAAEQAGNAKAGAEALAATAVAKLVKLQATLQAEAGAAYEEHLKVTVEALEDYLSNIAAAATNVPEELVPDGLERAIESFSVKVAELSGKLAELSEDVYFKVKGGVGALQASTGRLVSALAERWVALKAAVKAQAKQALEQLSEYSGAALQAACTTDLREQAQVAFDTLRSRFGQVVDAAGEGLQQVKESLQETADNLAAAVVALGVELRANLAKVYHSETVQQTLEMLKTEIEELKKLIVAQSMLVHKFVSAFATYFARFLPKFVVNKLTAARDRAHELVEKISKQLEALMSDVTDGEATTLELEDASGADVAEVA